MSLADATKLQILNAATETVEWEATFPTTGNATISNATILATLRAGTNFIIRAWNQPAGLNSSNHAQTTARGLGPHSLLHSSFRLSPQ